MSNKSILILIILFFLTSCNYRLVNKRHVVQDTKGYLVFREGEVIFFPFKDTIDAHFLADKTKDRGYRIGFDTYWLDSLSTDYSNLLYIENDTKFSIIPVEIRYYLGSGWQKEDEYSSIGYKWKNETFELPYRLHDWRSILEVHLLRKSDKERAKNLNIDYGPLHYRQSRKDWPGLNY